MVTLSSLERPLSPRGIHVLICKTLLSFSLPVWGFLCKGISIPRIHWKQSLTCPLQLIMLMGKKGWRPARLPPPLAMSGWLYWLQSLMEDYGDGWGFTWLLQGHWRWRNKAIWLWSLSSQLGFQPGLPCHPPTPPLVHHAHPTRSGFPEHLLVKLPNCLEPLNGSSWPGLRAL